MKSKVSILPFGKHYLPQVFLTLKFLVFVLLSYFIISKIAQIASFDEVMAQMQTTANSKAFLYSISIVLLLAVANWGIEARKWQFLANSIEKISLYQALKAVLAGVSISMFTPNRTGEFAGKLLFFNNNENRAKSISLSVLGSIAQLVVTLSLGSIMLGVYLNYIDQMISLPLFQILVFALCVAFICLVLLFYFHIPLLFVVVKKSTWVKKLLPYVSPLRKQSYTNLSIVLLYSVLRYVVFLFQFYIALNIFGVDIPVLIGLVLLPIIYFALAVIPSVSLSELGLRESMSLLLIGPFSDNYVGIVAASAFIWIVNLALPALVGAIIILLHRFKTS